MRSPLTPPPHPWRTQQPSRRPATRRCPASPLPLSGPATATTTKQEYWSAELSSALYNVDGWGTPYFFVNNADAITVRPHGASTLPGQEIDLAEVVAAVAGLGLPRPLLLRFPDVLRHRVEALNVTFTRVMRSAGYGSRYQCVYPVKCNQDRHVVEDVVEFDAPSRFGLESGSKPELLLATTSRSRSRRAPSGSTRWSC
jgi:arginine decarboxylase